MPNVLIVDDDEGIRRMMRLTLSAEGYELTTAVNGREALRAIDTREPDAVVLDLQMPIMNGYEFLKEMRASGFSTPVVVISANHPGPSAALDAQAFIPKPFSPDALVGTLRRLVGGEGQDRS